jgi:hypothetical protein
VMGLQQSGATQHTAEAIKSRKNSLQERMKEIF